LEARSRAIGPIPRTSGGRRGSRTLKAHRSPGFEPGAVADRLALPSSSSGGRNRTCVPPVNSRALVPARTPPESRSSCQTVGMAGFEPALSCSRSRRISQAFPHPESSRSPTSAQRESNPHVRHGEAVGYRYIMGTFAAPRLSKSREHRVGVEPTSPPYEGGVFAAGRPVPESRWDRRGSNPHRTG
jgi:hypothetical protein